MSKLRKIVKTVFGLYDIEDLTVGGNCGCCGKWIPNEIFEKNNNWGLCDECANTNEDKAVTTTQIKKNRTYYYELEKGHGRFSAETDAEALSYLKRIQNIDDVLILYRESNTDNGLPFISLYNNEKEG